MTAENNMLLKTFIKYVALSVAGMTAISGYILADTFFVSKGMGTDGLTALNLAIPVYNFIHGTGLMLGMGGATKYAIHKSRKEHERGNFVFTNTVYLGVLFSVIFMLTGIFLSERLSVLLGAGETVFEMTNTYMKILLLFSPAFIFNDILLCYIRNDDAPNLSMIAMIVGSLSNVLLDYIFIFPCKMGIFGAVSATGLAPVISISILSAHFIGRKNNFRLEKTGLNRSLVKNNIVLGFPSLIAQLSSGIVMIVFNFIVLDIAGNVGVAAYGIIANISLVVVAVFSGIEQGVQPLISATYGSRKRTDLRSLILYTVFSVLIFSAAVYLILYLSAENIVSIFNGEKNNRLGEIAARGLRLYYWATVCVGLNIVSAMFFTATEKVLPAHIISMLRGIVLIIPVALLCSRLWDMAGIWLSYPLTETIVCIVAAILSIIYKRHFMEEKNRPPERQAQN